MNSSRIVLLIPLVVASVALSACSTGVTPTGSGGAPGSHSAAASAPAVPAGTVSTEGVCGLVPIAQVDSMLGRSYANSNQVVLPDFAYCDYTAASGAGEFEIQVVPSSAGALNQLNEATGGKLSPQSGIGDSAYYSDIFPELVVVYGTTTIAVGQSLAAAGDSTITLNQLKKLAEAVHAAG